MDWSDVAKNFGPLGLVMGALVVLGRDWLRRDEKFRMQELSDRKEVRLRELEVEEKKADGFVSALTAIGMKVDAHHTTDIQSHQQLASSIAELHGKVDGVLDERERTPVEGVQRVTPPHGVAVSAGYYPPQRPPTKGGR